MSRETHVRFSEGVGGGIPPRYSTTCGPMTASAIRSGTCWCASRNSVTNNPSIAAGSWPMANLVIARDPIAAELKSVERRLARHPRAVRPSGRQLADQHRHHRMVPQLVVVVEVLIAERNPEHALPHQSGHQMSTYSAAGHR